MQAALGLAQVEQLDKTVKRKREIGNLYTKLLSDIPGIQLPMNKTEYADNIYWVFGMVLDDSIKMKSEDVLGKLAEKKIGTRPFFWPMHQQPVFNKRGLFLSESYPVAERLAVRGFYLPSGVGTSDDQIEEACAVVKKVLK